MAVANNKSFLQVSGTFSGSVDTTYKVRVKEDNGTEKFHWKKLESQGSWTDYSSLTTIVVNTEFTLDNGVKIKFTRTSASSYNHHDVWNFTAYAHLELSDISGEYKYIQTLDENENRNLLAITDAGKVSVVSNIDSDNPTVSSDSNVSLGEAVGDYDFVSHNKELYVAKGVDNPPQWLGYTKNSGMAGQTDLKLKTAYAMDVLSESSRANVMAFDKSVVLRGGGGANTKDAKIIAGIKYGTNEVYVMNIDTDKMYKFTCPTDTISIKRFWGFNSGSPNYYCDGFAVLRKGEGSLNGAIDLWDLQTASGGRIGQNTNKSATIGISTLEPFWRYYGDFLVIPKLADMSSSSQKYTIVLSNTRSAHTGFDPNMSHTYGWLFKSDEFTLDTMLTTNLVLGTGFDTDNGPSSPNVQNVTPKLNVDEEDNKAVNPGKFHYLLWNPQAVALASTGDNTTQNTQYPYWFGVPEVVFQESKYRPRIEEEALGGSLEFGGWDNGGANPIVYFTARMKATGRVADDFNSYYQRNEIYNPEDHSNGNNGHSGYNTLNTLENSYSGITGFTNCRVHGPFIRSGETNRSQSRYFYAKWITWGMPINNITGRVHHKMFLHTEDYQDNNNIEVRLSNNLGYNNVEFFGDQDSSVVDLYADGQVMREVIPSKYPLFGMLGRFNCHSITSDKTKRTRQVLSYVRGGTRQLLTFRHGEEVNRPGSITETTKPSIFPNDWSAQTSNGDGTAYSRFFKDDQSTNYWSFNDTLSGNVARRGFGIDSDNTFDGGKVRGTLQGSTSSDDKNSYRICEGIYTLSQDASQDWVPDVANDKQQILSVPYNDHLVEQRFEQFYTDNSRPNGNNTSATNKFTSNDVAFNVVAAEQTGSQNSYAGALTKKNFYQASLVYDGYQESPLISVVDSTTNTSDEGITREVKIDLTIKDGYNVSDRVTAVAIYRATSLDDTSSEPDTLYRFVEEIPLYQFNYSTVNSAYEFTYFDKGDVEGTYEAINGVSEKLKNIHINYSVITKQNGYMFAGNCKHPQLEDTNNYVFRSQPAKYSIFDWTKDFIQLPFVPIALKGFMGRVYAFSNTQVAIINPDTLFIEDVIEGIGCINHHTIKVSDVGMFWCDYRNVYLASPRFNSVGDAIKTVSTLGWDNLDNAVKDKVRIGIDARRKCFLLFFTVDSSHRVWLYSYKRQRWDLGQTSAQVMDTVDSKDGPCITLLSNGKISKFMANNAIKKDWEWESKKIRMGETMVDKKIRNIKIEGSSRTNTSIAYKVEGDTSYNSGTDISTKFTGAQNRAIALASEDKGKQHHIKVKITGDNTTTGSNTRVRALSVIYKPKRPK
tara:strand:+ start:3517 stop:7494 length:3978 start_codon:yes stop_codon:yes gene_type:complete